MGDVWESDGVVVETWESSTEPGVTFTTVIRDGDIVATAALADLTDVDVVSDPPAQDDVLAWDDTAEKWTPATLDGGVALSDAAPQDLGTAAAGTSEDASRADHVHDMPTAADIAVDASGFNGNLTTSDDTVQEIAQKVDDLVIPAAGIADPGGSNDDFLQRKSGVWTNRTVAQVKADLDMPEHVAAYAAPLWFTDNGEGWSSSTLHYMVALGLQTWVPVLLAAGTYDRIAVSTTVAAASTWRLGIDSCTSQFRPGTNVLDAGTVDMNATAGTQEIAISFVVESTDWFWLRVKCDAYTAPPTALIVNGVASSRPAVPAPGWPAYGVGSTRSLPALRSPENAGAGAFAAPPAFNSIIYAQSAPRVYLRRSA